MLLLVICFICVIIKKSLHVNVHHHVYSVKKSFHVYIEVHFI